MTASVKDGYNVTHVNSDVQKMIKKEKLIPSGVEGGLRWRKRGDHAFHEADDAHAAGGFHPGISGDGSSVPVIALAFYRDIYDPAGLSQAGCWHC